MIRRLWLWWRYWRHGRRTIDMSVGLEELREDWDELEALMLAQARLSACPTYRPRC